MAEETGTESAPMDLTSNSEMHYALVIKPINSQDESGEYIYLSEGPPLEIRSVEDLEKFRIEFIDCNISKLKENVSRLENTKKELSECLDDAIARLKNLENKNGDLKHQVSTMGAELNESRLNEEKFKNKLVDAENNLMLLLRQHDERIRGMESDRMSFVTTVNNRIQHQAQEARDQHTIDQQEILKAKSDLSDASLEIGRLNRILKQERGTALNCILKRMGVSAEDIMYVVSIFYEASNRGEKAATTSLQDPRILRTSPANIPLNN